MFFQPCERSNWLAYAHCALTNRILRILRGSNEYTILEQWDCLLQKKFTYHLEQLVWGANCWLAGQTQIANISYCIKHERFFGFFFLSGSGFELKSLPFAWQVLYHLRYSASPDMQFLLLVAGFELRASHLLGRCSTTWAFPPALFCVGYFWDRILQTTCLG
jgi:hypothetical protein